MTMIKILVLRLWAWMNRHRVDADAHHTKYTNAEAVAAVAAGDAYVKNIGDTITGSLISTVPTCNLVKNNGDSGLMLCGGTNTTTGAYFTIYGEDMVYGAGGWLAYTFGSAGKDLPNAKVHFQYRDTSGSYDIIEVFKTVVNIHDLIVKNPKNHAASALSGTKKVVEIDIGGVSYYFEVYPTKA